MTDQRPGTQVEERWLPIAGYEGRYEVSDMGSVRSWLLREGSRVTKRAVPVLLTPTKGGTKGEYRKVCLHGPLGPKYKFVHRLVADAFIGACPEGMEAAHDDGVGHHNWVGNIAWKTRKANHADKHRHGTAQHGEAAGAAKLSRAEVLAIRDAYPNAPGTELAERYGVSHCTIYAIIHRKTWRHI